MGPCVGRVKRYHTVKKFNRVASGIPLAYILKGLAYLVREPIPNDSNMTVTFGGHMQLLEKKYFHYSLLK